MNMDVVTFLKIGFSFFFRFAYSQTIFYEIFVTKPPLKKGLKWVCTFTWERHTRRAVAPIKLCFVY